MMEQKSDSHAVPSIKKMVIGRKLNNGDVNKTYIFFCKHFLKCTVGSKKFKKGVKTFPISKVATASDEALCLLLLENSETRWTMELEAYMEGRDADIARSKYTSSGINKSMRGYTKKHSGWANQGISRFNDLVKKCKDDRNQNGTWFDKIMEKEFNGGHENGDNNSDLEHEVEIVRATNELFDDDNMHDKQQDVGGSAFV
jgi:hypothetical protein